MVYRKTMQKEVRAVIFFGCDGGSTKTECLLADHTGRVLAHRVFPGCNYAFLGERDFRSLMTGAIREMLELAGITAEEVTSAMLGLTIYGEISGTEELFPAVICEVLPNCPVWIANDSVVGWGGSLAGRSGIHLQAGTGSIAYGQDSGGQGCRTGGWSLFFADEGSCSWIGRQLITEFVKQADGRRPHTVLYDELRKELSLKDDMDFSGYLQTDIQQDASLLAKLQFVALRAAQQGDRTAQEIYNHAAEELTELAVAVRKQLEFPQDAPVTVSCSGGLFRAGEMILEPLRTCMKQHGFILAQPRFSPVIGALILAARQHISLEESDRMAEAVAMQIG